MVAKEESLVLTDEAAVLLARLADGALRDALSLLESCAAAAGSGPIDAEAVRRQLGISDDGSAAALLCAILDKDLPASLKTGGRDSPATEKRTGFSGGRAGASALSAHPQHIVCAGKRAGAAGGSEGRIG